LIYKTKASGKSVKKQQNRHCQSSKIQCLRLQYDTQIYVTENPWHSLFKLMKTFIFKIRLTLKGIFRFSFPIYRIKDQFCVSLKLYSDKSFSSLNQFLLYTVLLLVMPYAKMENLFNIWAMIHCLKYTKYLWTEINKISSSLQSINFSISEKGFISLQKI
jgi:hypothetical protein